MTTLFPAALDTLTNPAATDKLNSPSHSAQHANANDAIEAIQQTIGITGSTDPATLTGGKVPYTGAITDVDLGERYAKAGAFLFDLTPTGTLSEGRMQWNDQDGTVDLRLKGNQVTLQLGQEQVMLVVNKTGGNLTQAGYSAVRLWGAQGNRPRVALAQADSIANAFETVGLATENINFNEEGFITTFGLVRGIDTTGSLQGELWVDGDTLYLSATVAGGLTKVKPTAPNRAVVVGYIVAAHATQGSIFVKPHYSEEITLTTTGSSGAATLSGNVLNIPNYSTAGGGGTVTSVAITMPEPFTVTGSPVTDTGTLTIGYDIYGPNLFLATSTSAPSGMLVRSIAEVDLPSISQSKITNLTTDLAAKAPLASPSFTGTPVLPDAATIGSGGPKVGYRNVPVNLSNAALTLSADYDGEAVYKNNTTAYTYTIPDGLPDGTVFTFANVGSAGNLTIAMSGTEVLRLAGTTTTGSRTVAPYGEATVHRIGGMWLCGGPGVT